MQRRAIAVISIHMLEGEELTYVRRIMYFPSVFVCTPFSITLPSLLIGHTPAIH